MHRCLSLSTVSQFRFLWQVSHLVHTTKHTKEEIEMNEHQIKYNIQSSPKALRQQGKFTCVYSSSIKPFTLPPMIHCWVDKLLWIIVLLHNGASSNQLDAYKIFLMLLSLTKISDKWAGMQTQIITLLPPCFTKKLVQTEIMSGFFLHTLALPSLQQRLILVSANKTCVKTWRVSVSVCFLCKNVTCWSFNLG